MELQVKTDKTGLQILTKITKSILPSFRTVMRSEGSNILKELRAEAVQTVRPLAPTSAALRKTKKSAWQLLAPIMRYDFDPDALVLRVGMVETGSRPVKRSAAVLAARSEEGWTVGVSEKSQRSLAKRLQRRHKLVTSRNAWGQVGGFAAYIPRKGKKAIPEQPVVEDVFEQRRAAIMSRIQRNLTTKLSGGRY